MKINGKTYTFRGTVSIVPADNLASHYLGGCKSLSSALRKCRHCMATADMAKEVCAFYMGLFCCYNSLFQFTSESFQCRSRETHSNHCASLNGPLGSHFATTYGVVRDSSLNSSRYFHVTEGLVPDVMHDVLEGSLPYEVKEMLRVLIAKKYFKLSYFMSVMENFAYMGVDARNKPVPIDSKILDSADHKLKQTGMLSILDTLSYPGPVKSMSMLFVFSKGKSLAMCFIWLSVHSEMPLLPWYHLHSVCDGH